MNSETLFIKGENYFDTYQIRIRHIKSHDFPFERCPISPIYRPMRSFFSPVDAVLVPERGGWSSAFLLSKLCNKNRHPAGGIFLQILKWFCEPIARCRRKFWGFCKFSIDFSMEIKHLEHLWKFPKIGQRFPKFEQKWSQNPEIVLRL